MHLAMMRRMTDKPDDTPIIRFSHFTLVADGEVTTANADFDTVTGPAICTVKIWAEDARMAVDILAGLGPQIGFEPAGEVQVYETDADMPAEDRPFAYQVNFTAYSADAPDDTVH
jgi:hypothetical protein